MFRIRIRQLREEAGYRSQQAFASAFGVAQTTVAGWEGGKREPNFETILRIADFFQVSVDYLLGRTENRNGNSDTLSTRERIAFTLQFCREKADLTQDDVSKYLSISAQDISDYERGVRDVDAMTLIRFLDLYRISPSQFFEKSKINIMTPHKENEPVVISDNKLDTLDDFERELSAQLDNLSDEKYEAFISRYRSHRGASE